MNEIDKLRYKMSRILWYINNRPIWSYYARKKIPMAKMDYHERIRTTSYNKAIEKLDRLAMLIKSRD
jgi:hypothetical protein